MIGAPTSAEVFERLARVPFVEQCALIDHELASDRALPELLAALVGLRDHEPLAYAVARLAERRRLERPDIAHALGRAFSALPDTGIQRVLGCTTGEWPEEQLTVLVECAAAAVRAFAIERVAAICLLDRWLENHAPDVRRALIDEAAAELRERLSWTHERTLDAHTCRLLLRVPGTRIASLMAECHDPVARATLSSWLDAFAAKILDVLERAPKSLSQANAEDILARRVYTDPGHFLVELLQNAEDAGARVFRVEFGSHAITVWHDGAAFDAKDVVGVLSIGQTTKHKEQIGFFGVGFKSVYEVCVRPQVYSGPFCFEIAEVSIPRQLDRPADLESGTRLVLSLRDPEHSLRGSRALFARALELPAETLLTLSNLERIEIRCGAEYRIMSAAIADADWSGQHDGPTHAPDTLDALRVQCVHLTRRERLRASVTTGADDDLPDEATLERAYLVASARFSCTDVTRERTRATKTGLITAVALDARGLPMPLERDTPTVFSFLPTRERSGLRFLVHAHFDVPVDRERLDLESAWNRWALSRAGRLLAGFIARAADRQRASGPAEGDHGFLDRLLDILPVADDLAHPTYRALLAELAAHARDIAFLRGADGRRIAPACAAVAEDRSLLAVLAGVDVTGTGVYLCDLESAAPRADRTREPSARARRERVATTLGARGFALDDVVALLERVLTPIVDGSACALPWLTPRSLCALYDALARAPAGRVREAHEQRLRALPLFVDEHGLQRLVSSLRRADSPALRALYSEIQPLLHPDLDEASDGADTSMPARAAWYRRMGLHTLTDADLLADLRVPERARGLVTRTRWGALFEHLAGLPTGALAGLGDCAIFPATRPISVDENLSDTAPELEPWLLAPLAHARDIAWLSDRGPIADVLACLRGPRPALILPDLQARHAGLLQRLGARVLDLAALLELSRDPGVLRIEHASEVRALHQAVDAMRSELSPRLAHELAAARLFPDRAGTLRPLVGEDCALIPWDVEDEELIALFAEAPWLDPTIGELAYVRTLGAPEMGPSAVARALVAASRSRPAEFIAAAGAHERALQRALGQGASWDAHARLRALYGYLSRAPGALSAEIREELARAPIWLADAEETDTRERHPLDALRLPARAPEVAAVYRDWPEFPVIDAGQPDAPDEDRARGPCSALDLARALALEHRLKTPDHETAILDLVDVSRHAGAARVTAAWPALVACVCACARELPHKKLAPLVHAYIFTAHGRPSSERYPLVDWQTGLEHAGVARARAPERDALIHGSRLVLDQQCEADLRPALDALGIQPAGPGDVIAALERDPLLAGPEARTRARAALAAAIQRHGPAILDAHARAALAALPIWPTVDGRMLPAVAVARSQDIGRSVAAEQDFWARAEALFRDALARPDADDENAPSSETVGALLAADAEDHAEVLACVLEFRDPLAALAQAVTHAARVNQPLEVQPELLRTPERVAQIFCALIGRGQPGTTASEPPLPWQLPLAVNAAGNLSLGPCYLATDAMRRIARHLPLHGELAHPAWAEVVERRAGNVLARVGPRRFLAALADAGREPWRLGERPHLGDAEARQALYDWLLEMRAPIAEDAQARGLLGRACVIATRAGYIRAPRDLLLDPELPDLGIDWNAHDEVPAELSAWLRATFAMDEKRLAPLVEHLLGAHEDAARAGDGARSAEILRFLARSLRVDRSPAEHADADPEVAALVKRFKLRKRLRVEDSRGEFTRPRALLAPEPGRWRQLHEFADELPARVSTRYQDPAVLALLHWAGADADIAPARLAEYLAGEHRRGGLHADLALARYLAERGHREPALRQELGLRERAFIPDRLGHLRAPGELYWPEGDAAEVIGDRPSCFPHPGFFHAVPPGIASWLPFRRAENATLADVVAHVRERADRGQPAPEAVLAWLDDRLRAGHIEARAVYQALAEVPFLVDDDGHIRPPRELSREHPGWLFGSRRGGFSAARTYSRLCAALKLPKTPGKREILDVCADILDDLERLGSARVLAREPDLLERLGRCLEILAHAGGPLPERLPVPVEDTRGEAGLCPAPRPGVLFLRRPAVLWQRALARQAEILVPLLVQPHPDDTRVEDMLARLGVPPLTHASAELLPAAAEYRAAEESARRARAPEPRPPDAGEPDAPEPEQDTRQVRRRRERAAQREREREQRRESARPPADPAGEREPDRAHRPEPDRERAASGGDTQDERGLLMRIRHWLRGQEQDAPDRHRPTPGPRPSRPDADADADTDAHASPSKPDREREYRPPGAGPGRRGEHRASLPDHSQWFRPRRRLGPQLGDNTAWAEDRAHVPVFGLAFAPRSLPAPHIYAAHTLWDRYDPGAQRFTRTALPAEWSQPAAPGSYRVHLRGRLPAGEVVLPVPAYGRVIELATTPAGGDLIDGPEGAHVLYSEAECDVSYTVILDQAPDFERARTSESDPGPAGHLLAPTTADSELPAEVLETVDLIQDTHARALDRALAVRAFIRERYYYDAAYLEDPELGRWLARVTRGRGNPHIAAMHAGRDASYLGRGVCYELNSLCCELLRRVGIPAAVATGWTLDRGALDEPDHMWAVALLPSPSGPRWLPLDASTTRDGTPLHAGRRPPGPWRARAHEQRQRPPRPPAWDKRQVRTHERGEATGAPLSDLMRVVRWLEEQAGQPPEGPAALRRRCRALLDDSEASERLLRALFGDSD